MAQINERSVWIRARTIRATYAFGAYAGALVSHQQVKGTLLGEACRLTQKRELFDDALPRPAVGWGWCLAGYLTSALKAAGDCSSSDGTHDAQGCEGMECKGHFEPLLADGDNSRGVKLYPLARLFEL